jgi:hypothetical protein
MSGVDSRSSLSFFARFVLLFTLGGVWFLTPGASADIYQNPALAADRGHEPDQAQRFAFGRLINIAESNADVADAIFPGQSEEFKNCARAENWSMVEAIHNPDEIVRHMEVLQSASEAIKKSDTTNKLDVLITPNRIAAIYIVGWLRQMDPMSTPAEFFSTVGDGLTDQEKLSISALSAGYTLGFEILLAACAGANAE